MQSLYLMNCEIYIIYGFQSISMCTIFRLGKAFKNRNWQTTIVGMDVNVQR